MAHKNNFKKIKELPAGKYYIGDVAVDFKGAGED